MLLEDLFDTETKKIYTKNRYLNRDKSKKDDKAIDAGTSSIVIPDKNDPSMVKKRSTGFNRTSKKEDGFKTYAEYIIKHKLGESNPYFPRIYVMKNFSDKNGTEMQQYKIEKLIPYYEVSLEEILAFLNKIADISEEWLQHIDMGDSSRLHNRLTWFIKDKIINNTESFYNGRIILKDPLLNDVREHFKTLIKNGLVLNDFSGKNCMYRRTPHGLQFVINDPFY